MQMEDSSPERRKEVRYPVEAKVVIRRESGETVRGMATNISSSGMRLCLEEGWQLGLHENVAVEIELPEHTERRFSSWGLGRIAYLDDNCAGIQLFGGEFERVPPRGQSD